MRSIVLAISAAALAASTAVASPPSNPLPAQSSAAPALHGHARLHRMLTPQERMLYRDQLRGAGWRSLTREQRCVKKRQMRRQLASLSPAAMQKLKAQLDAEWTRLPAAKKQRIEQRIANRQEKRAAGPQQREARRGGGCRAEGI